MSEVENGADGTSRSPLDTAIVIFLWTALAYAAAFAYEVGYLGYFGLPPALAQVDLKQLLVAALLLVGLLGTLSHLSDWGYRIWPRQLPTSLQRRLAIILAVLATNALGCWVESAGWLVWLAALLLPSVWLVFEYLVPIWVGEQNKTYAEKVAAAVAFDAEVSGKGIELLTRHFGAARVNAATGAFMLIVFALILGGLTARLQEIFPVVLDRSCLVIREGSNGFLCVSYDANAHLAKSEFRFIPESDVQVSLQKTGRIKVDPIH